MGRSRRGAILIVKQIFQFLFLVITGRFRLAFELLRDLRLGTKLAFVAIGVGSYLVHQYPSELYLYGERAYYGAVLALRGKADDGIPLSRSARRNLDGLIHTLQGDQMVELMRRDLGVTQGYNTWAVAQMAASLGEALPVQPAAIQSFFESNADAQCSCWRETPDKPPHAGATGWTLFAMAKLGLRASPQLVRFLLDMQSPNGWWPLHPTNWEPKNASTYATAWATLALCSQLPLQETAENAEADRIKRAIKSSLNWLDKSEISQSARWLDYPANSPSFRSASISGLIVHTKRACGNTGDAEALHRQWLDNLPIEVTSASTVEASNTYITLKNGNLDFDRTRHYTLQWSLVATVDAFQAGSLAQRAAALQWIERILTPGLASPEVRNQNWVSAELLYALKYLRAHAAAP